MKYKTYTVALLALLVSSLAGMSQSAAPSETATETPGASTEAAAPAATSAPAEATPAAPEVVEKAPAPAVEQSAKESAAKETPAETTAVTLPKPVEVAAAEITVAQATTPATPTTTTPTPTTTEPAAVIPPATPAPAPETNSVPSGQKAVIPLIVMDDVPLSDAIRNLARQAGLNYMLDPKISFGQVGPDGKTIAQPSVSIRWENVTAEQALYALLNNYNLQLLEDPKTHIARITVKDPAAPDPLETRIVQLKYATPSNILSSVQTALLDKRSRVVADTRTSQLVVVGTEKEIQEVDRMVERLDTQTKQVLIEARLLETSLSPQTSKGLDWSGTLEGQHLAFGNNLQQKPVDAKESDNKVLSSIYPKMLFDTAKGFNPATAFLDADGVNAVFSFLNKNAEARVISAPRTVTLDNEAARIEVTRASPIINVTAGTANTTGGSAVTYTNLGIILNVLPRISANNYVNLKVVPEVSRIFDTVTKNIGGNPFQADEYDIRKMETRVMIPSGNTLVLGGLVQDDVRNGTTKVPLFGDIPFLGHAFRSETKSRQKSNLIVFITPTIVEEADFQPTPSNFLRTPAPTKDSVDGEWSAWDTGKPMDWSKPKGVSN